MFSSRIKLLVFSGLIIFVVLVTWFYARQSYSAYNVKDPEGSVLPNATVTGVKVVDFSPTSTIVQASPDVQTTNLATLEDAGCTLPLNYWQQNKDRIPPQILVNVITADQTEACVNYAGNQICTILEEATYAPNIVLKQQFLVTIMNYLSGADPVAVEDAINGANEWLRSNLFAASFTEQELRVAQHYAQTLQSYNEGYIGPGICDESMIPLTQAEIPVSSPTITSTATSSPTLTSTPTVRRTVVIILPTSTEAPERPEPTQTSPPPATDTQPAPTDTDVPPPTATQIPPPTSTDIPTPTPVPEEPTIAPVP